jgi:hypothetical protein
MIKYTTFVRPGAGVETSKTGSSSGQKFRLRLCNTGKNKGKKVVQLHYVSEHNIHITKPNVINIRSFTQRILSKKGQCHGTSDVIKHKMFVTNKCHKV